MWDTLEPLKDGLQELRLTRLCPECGVFITSHAMISVLTPLGITIA